MKSKFQFLTTLFVLFSMFSGMSLTAQPVLAADGTLQAVGGFAWEDLDHDGIRETGSGELTKSGVTVHLYACDGSTILQTQVTNVIGGYLFYVEPGSYKVHFVEPTGFIFTLKDQGSSEGLDSDANPATGFTDCVTIAAGGSNKEVDAGFFREVVVEKAAIGDRVWFDANRNGVQDAGEDGVQGVTVRLLDCAGNVLATTTTNLSGLYLFSGLMPGEYNIQFVLPSGYVFSPQNVGDDAFDSDANASGFTACTTLVSGETDRTWDAGIMLRQEGPGTGTPGYWKNHPEAWPVETITIGGVVYTKEQAIWWMNQPDGDKTITLFRALVAAKLNVLIGNDDSCIAGTISAADAWFVTFGPVGSGVPARSAAWRIGEPLYELLDLYNNGGLCAPHRD